jgi:hypothetical protein
MSNWGGDLTDTEAQCFKANDVELVIPGTQNAAQYQQQRDVAISNGLRVQAYVYLLWPKALIQTQRAISLMGKDEEILWLDVEDDTSGMTQGQIVSVLEDCVEACEQAHVRCGIYASQNTWTTLTGDSQDFSDLPLWNAFYDNDPDLDFARFPYGGWTAPLLEQYGNTQVFCGQSVDLNVINEEEDDMGMTAAERAEMDAMQAQIELLKGYAWRDALRINALETHVHSIERVSAVNEKTEGPVQP